MLSSRIKKNNVYPCKPQFYCIKVEFKGVKIIQVSFVMVIESEPNDSYKNAYAPSKNSDQLEYPCCPENTWESLLLTECPAKTGQTARIYRLIRVFAGRKCNLVGNVVAPIIFYLSCVKPNYIFWSRGYKTFSCSTQLSMKYVLLLKLKLLNICKSFLAKHSWAWKFHC